MKSIKHLRFAYYTKSATATSLKKERKRKNHNNNANLRFRQSFLKLFKEI